MSKHTDAIIKAAELRRHGIDFRVRLELKLANNAENDRVLRCLIYDFNSQRVYPQMQSFSTVRNELGLASHYVWVFSNITQLKDAVARLDFLAHHDPLTGLPNRLLLFSRLEHCIDLSKREHKSAALLMLDLGRFKNVNDSFGHLAGDELLQQVAERLKHRLRGIDTVTRLGGDDFAALLQS
jgi:PleD family two-component response regulator